MAKDPKQQAAETAASALEQVVKRPVSRPKINEADLFINTRGTEEVIKGTQRTAIVWLEGPAYAKLNKTSERRLAKINPDPDAKVNRIVKVRAAVKKGTKTVFVWVTDDEDLEGLDVSYTSKFVSFNLIELLAPLKLTIDSGYEESFQLEFAEESDPVFPALKFDLEKRLERKVSAKARARAKKAAERKAAKAKLEAEKARLEQEKARLEQENANQP